MSAHPFLPKTIAIGSASRRVWGLCSSTWDRKLWLVGQLLVLPWARVSRSAARVSPRSNRVQRPWERRSSWSNELATFPFQPFATSTPRPRPQRFLHSCSTHIHIYATILVQSIYLCKARIDAAHSACSGYILSHPLLILPSAIRLHLTGQVQPSKEMRTPPTALPVSTHSSCWKLGQEETMSMWVSVI